MPPEAKRAIRAIGLSGTILIALAAITPSASAQEYDLDPDQGDLTYDSRSYGRPHDDRRVGDPRDLQDRRRSGDPRGTRDEEEQRRTPRGGSRLRGGPTPRSVTE